MVRRQVGDRSGTRSTDVFEHDLDAEITTNLAVVEHRDRPRHLWPIRVVVDMVVPPLGREHLHASKSPSNAPDYVGTAFPVESIAPCRPHSCSEPSVHSAARIRRL